jgi:hypothetical protein
MVTLRFLVPSFKVRVLVPQPTLPASIRVLVTAENEHRTIAIDYRGGLR